METLAALILARPDPSPREPDSLRISATLGTRRCAVSLFSRLSAVQ